MSNDMATRMRRLLAYGEQRDKVYSTEMLCRWDTPSPESTPATLGDLQAVERANALLAERIARLEAQVARIPGFLAAIKEVSRVPE